MDGSGGLGRNGGLTGAPWPSLPQVLGAGACLAAACMAALGVLLSFVDMYEWFTQGPGRGRPSPDVALMLSGVQLMVAWGLGWSAWRLLTARRRAWRMSRRVRRQVCARCGYDLRGGGEFCPECGLHLPESYESMAARLEILVGTGVVGAADRGEDTGASQGSSGGEYASYR